MSSEPPNPKPKSFFDRLAAAFHEEKVEDRGRLLSLMRDAQSHNVMDKETLSMMEGALEVSDLRADDLMIPRAQVQEIDLTGTLDDWIRTVIESGHSRFPAVDGDLDNVQGILHAKDLLRLMINPELDVRKLLRPARFIPESQPINVLLRDFKSTRSHLALVIDEFGSISGLITIEDVLEQIVGDISDEFDRDDPSGVIVQESTNRWRVGAHLEIEAFNEYFSAELRDDYCETVGGLVTDRLEHVPQKGEVVEEAGFRFTVADADERQAQALIVERL